MSETKYQPDYKEIKRGKETMNEDQKIETRKRATKLFVDTIKSSPELQENFEVIDGPEVVVYRTDENYHSERNWVIFHYGQDRIKTNLLKAKREHGAVLISEQPLYQFDFTGSDETFFPHVFLKTPETEARKEKIGRGYQAGEFGDTAASVLDINSLKFIPDEKEYIEIEKSKRFYGKRRWLIEDKINEARAANPILEGLSDDDVKKVILGNPNRKNQMLTAQERADEDLRVQIDQEMEVERQNNEQEIIKFAEELNRICKEKGITTLLIDHAGAGYVMDLVKIYCPDIEFGRAGGYHIASENMEEGYLKWDTFNKYFEIDRYIGGF